MSISHLRGQRGTLTLVLHRGLLQRDRVLAQLTESYRQANQSLLVLTHADPQHVARICKIAVDGVDAQAVATIDSGPLPIGITHTAASDQMVREAAWPDDSPVTARDAIVYVGSPAASSVVRSDGRFLQQLSRGELDPNGDPPHPAELQTPKHVVAVLELGLTTQPIRGRVTSTPLGRDQQPLWPPQPGDRPISLTDAQRHPWLRYAADAWQCHMPDPHNPSDRRLAVIPVKTREPAGAFLL